MTTARRRPKRRGTDARTALRNVPILADIDDEQLERLATTVERRHVPANQWLFHAGEPADSIYIVDSGRFVAVAQRDTYLLRWHPATRSETWG